MDPGYEWTPMDPRYGLVLGRDGAWASMGPNKPSGWMDGPSGEMGLRLGRWHRWALGNDESSAWMGPYSLWALGMDGLRVGMGHQHKFALEMD